MKELVNCSLNPKTLNLTVAQKGRQQGGYLSCLVLYELKACTMKITQVLTKQILIFLLFMSFLKIVSDERNCYKSKT